MDECEFLNNKFYLVRDKPDKFEAANLLAELNNDAMKIINYMKKNKIPTKIYFFLYA